MVPACIHSAHAYCYRCPFGLTYPSCDLKCAKDIEEAIRTMTSRARSRRLSPSRSRRRRIHRSAEGIFQRVVGIIRKYGGLFICDEVQTAWGRTGGKMVRHRALGRRSGHHDLRQRHGQRRADRLRRSPRRKSPTACRATPFSTFGGNPVTCAAAMRRSSDRRRRSVEQCRA